MRPSGPTAGAPGRPETRQFTVAATGASVASAECRIRGAPGGTRTPDPLIRSQMLYPLSYGRVCDARPGASSQGSRGAAPEPRQYRIRGSMRLRHGPVRCQRHRSVARWAGQTPSPILSYHPESLAAMGLGSWRRMRSIRRTRPLTPERPASPSTPSTGACCIARPPTTVSRPGCTGMAPPDSGSRPGRTCRRRPVSPAIGPAPRLTSSTPGRAREHPSGSRATGGLGAGPSAPPALDNC